jgi:choline dehydrogenase-like flavoprotein
VLFDGPRAAASASAAAAVVEARASGEVILSAGSIGSSQILQLSGVGPGELAG